MLPLFSCFSLFSSPILCLLFLFSSIYKGLVVYVFWKLYYDAAGQEKFGSLTCSYYRGAHGIILGMEYTTSQYTYLFNEGVDNYWTFMILYLFIGFVNPILSYKTFIWDDLYGCWCMILIFCSLWCNKTRDIYKSLQDLDERTWALLHRSRLHQDTSGQQNG